MNEAGRHESQEQMQERFHDDKSVRYRECEIKLSAVFFLFTDVVGGGWSFR
jgi:hypothetical protein